MFFDYQNKVSVPLNPTFRAHGLHFFPFPAHLIQIATHATEMIIWIKWAEPEKHDKHAMKGGDRCWETVSTSNKVWYT